MCVVEQYANKRILLVKRGGAGPPRIFLDVKHHPNAAAPASYGSVVVGKHQAVQTGARRQVGSHKEAAAQTRCIAGEHGAAQAEVAVLDEDTACIVDMHMP